MIKVIYLYFLIYLRIL